MRPAQLALFPVFLFGCYGRDLLAPAPGPAGSVVHYDLNVTVGWRSPDCFARPVILTNEGYDNTTILEVTQGQTLEVTVYNNLPPDYPLVLEGITVHWHGLNQRGSEWYDGVGYVHQCPIQVGKNFTYRMQINDQPGTYFWHGHTGVERGDGFEGLLIIRPPGRDILQDLYHYDEEEIIELTDWYHDLYGSLSFATNRPFDTSKQTASTGVRKWIDMPQAILMNRRGYWQDCKLGPAGNSVPPTCNVTTETVPAGRSSFQPGATSLTTQGCTHYSLTVEPGKKYRLRVVNLSTLVMLSFKIEGHNLTIVSADATPTDPIDVDHIDVNSGQRYDVILTANASEPRSYYMSATPQGRAGCTAGFGFLKYSTGNLTALPPTPTPASNATLPWGADEVNAVHTADWLVNPTNPQPEVISQLAGDPDRKVPQDVKVSVKLDVNQPLSTNGQLHWAFNDISTYKQPTCKPIMNELYEQKQGYLTSNQVAAPSPSIDYSLMQIANNSQAPQVFVYGQPGSVRQVPVTGQYIVELDYNDTVEIIIQNAVGNSSGGDTYLGSLAPSDYASRKSMEQHPIHIHGHHAWATGYGYGVWNESSKATYNLVNPIYRDVFTLPNNGWLALRFIADNPGVWELHCHLEIHLYMGQQLLLAEAVDRISAPPKDLPECPETCQATFAGWAPNYVANKYNNSGFV